MFGRKKRTDVIVVGAGPVGRMLALTLKERGVDVRIFDKEWRSVTRSYAAALHPSSLSLLDRFGLTDEVLKHANRLEKIALFDRESQRAEVDLSTLSSKHPYLAVIPQSELERVLETALEVRRSHIQWQHRTARLEQHWDRVEADIDVIENFSSGYSYAHSEWTVDKTLHYESAFIVGADGADSLLRRIQKIPVTKLGPLQEFDVFEFASESNFSSEMRLLLENQHSNVLWSLPGGRQRWSFEVANSETPQREQTKSRLMMALPGEASPRTSATMLRELIRERATWFDEASILDIAWSGEVRFERRLAQSLGQNRLWLVGDAVHQTSPIGIQSMNAGLMEAYHLGNQLADLLQDKGTPNDLQEYTERVDERWQQLLRPEETFECDAGADEWIKKNLSRIVPSIPAMDDDLLEALSQLSIRPKKR